MYSRMPKPRNTPLDPAPRGKRRRVEGAERADAGQKVESVDEAKTEGSLD